MNRGKYMLGELIVIACGAAFLGLPTLIYLRKKKELLNYGILTRGNISKIEAVSENEEDNDRYYYYVSYCDHKGNRHESKLLRHDRNCAYKQGDEIMIRYKADDPKFVVEDKR